MIKDSGERRETITGAVRDRAVGKGRFDLLPKFALEGIARHFENGAIKYGDSNWEKGMPVSWFVDSLMRHTDKARRGQVDEDHVAALGWNALCMLDTMIRIEIGLLPQELLDFPTLPEHAQSKLDSRDAMAKQKAEAIYAAAAAKRSK